MRYKINYDKTINQLTPYYLRGRKLILYLQGILAPLQVLADSFSEWAKEMRIEASMTSQVFKLEWFLNRKFEKYFASKEERITISSSSFAGVPFYFEKSADAEHTPLYLQSEQNENTPVFRRFMDSSAENRYSFVVNSPAVNDKAIDKNEYISQLQYWIDRYRLAGKTYIIKINQ